MHNAINKWTLIAMLALMAFTVKAFDDDELKKSTKKNGQIKVEKKEPKKLLTHRNDDTLIFEKIIDDTLTFDDEKTSDDTLIFADDEINFKDKSKNKNTEISIKQSTETMVLNPAIYPNPCFGQTIIDLNTQEDLPTEITITTIQGALVLKTNVTSKIYEITDLAVGSYIVTISNGGQIVQKRLFVRR